MDVDLFNDEIWCIDINHNENLKSLQWNLYENIMYSYVIYWISNSLLSENLNKIFFLLNYIL
jgi:hypothetical protein